jgi:hypothetical protein
MNFNNNNNFNYMGILNVELKIFKNPIEINGNVEYDISLEIVNNDNDKLINKINNDFKILDIIRNTNRLEKYKNLIIENEKLILESVNRKKEDIIEVASYMIKKEKEIETYKQKINELIRKQIPNIQEISINDSDFNNTNSINVETQTQTLTIDNVTQTNIIEEINENILNSIQLIDYYLDKNIEYYLEYLNIENKTSENKHINIELKYKNLLCIIEMKKNKKNIGPNEIDKFIKKHIRDNNYNCGLYISMESEFTKNSNIIDFEINIINKKPVIFISNVSNNKNKIDYAIKLLNYIINYKNINNYNENEIDCYVAYINDYYNHLIDNIVDYDDRIFYNKKKYSNLEIKIEKLIKKRDLFLNSIKDLEKIQTLQFVNDIGDKNIEDKNIEDKNIEDKNIEDKNIEDKNIEDKNIEDKNIEDENIEDENIEDENIEDENIEDENIELVNNLNKNTDECIKTGLKSLVKIVEEFKNTNDINKI